MPKPITEPTENPPHVDDTRDVMTAARVYRAHGWVFIPDAPASVAMTAEEFMKVPKEERALM